MWKIKMILNQKKKKNYIVTSEFYFETHNRNLDMRAVCNLTLPVKRTPVFVSVSPARASLTAVYFHTRHVCLVSRSWHGVFKRDFALKD